MQLPVRTFVIWDTEDIYISIRKIRIKRDLVRLCSKFNHLSYLWLFCNLGCGWEDVGSRNCFLLIFLLSSGILRRVWSDSSCAWRFLSHLNSIVLRWRSLITWSKARKMNAAHWLAPITVRVTMTVSHTCAAIEYDDSEVARGTCGGAD